MLQDRIIKIKFNKVNIGIYWILCNDSATRNNVLKTIFLNVGDLKQIIWYYLLPSYQYRVFFTRQWTMSQWNCLLLKSNQVENDAFIFKRNNHIYMYTQPKSCFDILFDFKETWLRGRQWSRQTYVTFLFDTANISPRFVKMALFLIFILSSVWSSTFVILKIRLVTFAVVINGCISRLK